MHVPSFIGDNVVDGVEGGTIYGLEKAETVTVTVSYYIGADAHICLDEKCKPIGRSAQFPATYVFENPGDGHLEINADGADIGYAVVASLDWN